MVSLPSRLEISPTAIINKCYYTKEHVAPSHLKNEGNGPTGKSSGNKVCAIFSASQQSEAVDDEDDYDGKDGL